MRDQSSEFDDNVEDMDIDEETNPIIQKDPKHERSDEMLIDDPKHLGKMNDQTCHYCFLAKSLENESFCSAHQLNFPNPISYHVMLVTAYDMRLDAIYWKRKNTYETKWGDSGYARIRMNQK